MRCGCVSSLCAYYTTLLVVLLIVLLLMLSLSLVSCRCIAESVHCDLLMLGVLQVPQCALVPCQAASLPGQGGATLGSFNTVA